MKRLAIAGLWITAVLGVLAADDARFSSLVSPADYAAAGLNTLSDAQRARLDALVENYKSGALAQARREADEAIAQKRAAEAEAARAATEAQAALAAAKAETMKAQRAQAEARKEAAGSRPAHAGLLATAKAMFASDPKKNEPVVESTIPGRFQGWVPHQVFTLANGQRWQIANADTYYVPLTKDPRVQIFPSATFGYWMKFPDLRAEVRVTLVGE